jgi:hypothetical protein
MLVNAAFLLSWSSKFRLLASSVAPSFSGMGSREGVDDVFQGLLGSDCHSGRPRSASLVIRSMVARIDDQTPRGTRQRLADFVLRIVRTNDGLGRMRGEMAAVAHSRERRRSPENARATKEARMVPNVASNQRPHPSQGADSSGPTLPARLGRRIALLLGGAFLLGMGMTAVVLWATSGHFGGGALSGAPLIAALLGGGGAMAVAAGLMTALFYSDRSGWDREVR